MLCGIYGGVLWCVLLLGVVCRAWFVSRGAQAEAASKYFSLVLCCVFLAGMAKNVLVAVADGSEDMESTITVDVLRRAGAQVVVASVGEKEVSCHTVLSHRTLTPYSHIMLCYAVLCHIMFHLAVHRLVLFLNVLLLATAIHVPTGEVRAWHARNRGRAGERVQGA